MNYFYQHLSIWCCSAAVGIFLFTLAQNASGRKGDTLPGNSSSLESLVAESLVNNRELKFYEAEIAVARGERRVASEWTNPELAIDLGGKQVRDLNGNNAEVGPAWSLSFGQSFEYPGRIALREAIANKQIKLAELGLAQFRAALAARVRTLGYRLMTAEQKAAAAREVTARFHELLHVLAQRAPAGVTPVLERRIIEASALTLDRRLTDATREREAARFELNQLRGVSVNAPLVVRQTETAEKPARSLPALLASARARSFDVRVRVVELEQQGFKVRLSENEKWPAVTVGPYTRGERTNDEQLEVGVGVQLPLPLWNQNRGKIAVAKARHVQAQVSLNVTLREVERKIAEAFQTYAAKQEALARWNAGTIASFRDAAEQGDRSYRSGALPIATYTELQKQYLDAVDAFLDTQAAAFESAQQLELLSGIAPGNAEPSTPPKEER